MNGKLLSISGGLITENKGFFGMKYLYSKRIEVTLFFCALFISTLSFTQVGPAGVNTGIELWLDASDLDADSIIEGDLEAGVILADSTFTTWVDKSTEPGYSFTIPTGGDFISPKYRALEATFGGHTVVDFGTSSALSFDNSNWNGDHTIFIVFKQKTSQATNTALFSSGIAATGSAGIDDYMRISISTGDFAYHTSDGTGGGSPTFTESVFGTQSDALADITLYTATRESNTITTYENGVLANTVTSLSGGDKFEEYVLNSNRDTTVSNNCLIAEIIIYNVVLTPSEIARIHNYLNCKYGSSFAGASPGGIDPCSLTHWIKADAGVSTSSGDQVDNWADQSINGFNGTSAGNERPHLLNQDNNFNPSIYFDAATGSGEEIIFPITIGDELMLGISDFNFYVVAAADTLFGSEGAMFADNLCANENGYSFRYDPITNEWGLEGVEASGSITNTVNPLVTNTSTNYSLLKVNRSANNYQIGTNELSPVALSSISYDFSSSPAATERILGKETDCSGTGASTMNPFEGKISEFIAVNNSISTIQDRQIQTYLGLKYGLNLNPSLTEYLASDSTVIWHEGSYWNGVAGIGQDNRSSLSQRISMSQDTSAIITMATTNDFTAANSDAARTSLSDGSFLIWGNNGNSASAAWNEATGPTNYAMLDEVWKVRKTGFVSGVEIQIDVDNLSNDIPSFIGNLYLVHHPTDLALATPILLTPNGSLWSTSTPINFADSSLFSFVVENSLTIEFSAATASSTDESVADNFPAIVKTGIINVPTSFTIDGTDGTATDPDDYTYIDTTIAVPAANYMGSTTPLNGPILVDDLINEQPDETIDFTFVNPANITGGAISSHVYTITDNDLYEISIGGPVDGAEGGTNISFVIELANGIMNTTGTDMTGTIAYSGNATSGTDYTEVFNYIISNTLGNTTIILPITNDFDVELLETVTATITSTTGQNIGTAAASATITDDDYGTFQVSIVSPTNALEGTSDITFTVELDNGAFNYTGADISGTLALTPTAVNGATNGTDYTNVTSFAIPNDSSYVLITVPVIDDGDTESTESVIATISALNIGGAGNINIAVDTANIADDESNNLLISIGSPVDGFENISNMTFSVYIDGGSTNSTGSAITGDVTLGGTATSGSDYTNVTTFSIPNGSNAGTITIPILDDPLLEGIETITANIVNPSNGAVLLISNATADIIDDEMTGLNISIVSQTNGVEGTSDPTFVVSLDGGLVNNTGVAIDGTVTYTGSALGGFDFGVVPTFSIPDLSSNAPLTLILNDDNLIEISETIIATISAPSVGTINGASDTGMITDDDISSVEVSVSSPITSIIEGTGPIPYVISFDGGATNETGAPITGTFAISGTSTVVDDYTDVTTFAIPDGANSVTVDVIIINDTDLETLETVVATISNIDFGITASATNNGISVDLIDDDSGTLTISIGNPVDVTEGPGVNVEFDVFIVGSAINNTGAAITGNVSFSGTAIPGTDFASVATFSIPQGANLVTLSMLVTDDAIFEPVESVIAIITSPSTGSIATASSTANITDDDASSIVVSVGSPTDGSEGGFPASYTVSLDNSIINSSGTAITGLIAWSGTSTLGLDFTANSTFSIPNNSNSAIIAATIFDDFAAENIETLTANISGASIGSIGTASATANIIDNDSIALAISIDSPVTGYEGSLNPSFTISLDAAITNGFVSPFGIEVPITGTLVLTGTAIGGVDYLDAVTFSIPYGAGSYTLTLPAINDLKIEPTETIIATISAPDFGAINPAFNTSTTNLDDDDLSNASLSIQKNIDGTESPIPIDAEFTVLLNGGLRNEMGVPLAGTFTLTGSATAGDDYINVSTFEIPNDTGKVVIPVIIFDDLLEEVTETIVATISNVNLVTISSTDVATADLFDDDTDSDHDGLNDVLDPNDVNIDTDGDGIHDGCDVDVTGDGINDNGVDSDGDGINDACDADVNGDGIVDNGPDVNNDGRNDNSWDINDADYDFLPDSVDPNDNNADIDNDGIADGPDVDFDGDGVNDNGTDMDADGIHDVADSDDTPTDNETDVGNLDDDRDGIDNDWDPVDDDAEGKQTNYIVSPNGDETNETLIINGIQFYDNHELRIFDRWGSPVYLSNDYQNDWSGEINQGVLLGENMLPEGVYYYTLDIGGGKEVARGFIEIRK